MEGRRGVTTILYETIISLLLVALFGVAAFGYINANAHGESYFSKFYAHDLATSADLVNAGAGDVILRYDNLKPSIDLTYWLSDGRVSVGKTNTANLENGLGVAYYGKTGRYDGDTMLIHPTYIVLRKAGGFSITDADKAQRACRVDKAGIDADKAVVYLETSSGAIKTAFVTALRGTRITTTDDKTKANIILSFERKTGDANTVTFSPTNTDGASYSCLVMQRLTAISTTFFTNNEPAASGKEFSLNIVLSAKTDAKLLDEQLGQSMGHALILLFNSGQTQTGPVPTPSSTHSPTPSPNPSLNPASSPSLSGSGNILLIGDSITVGYSEVILKQGNACGKMTFAKPDAEVGRWTVTMLDRSNAALANKPSVVVILGGINDIAGESSAVSVESNLQKIADRAEANGALVVYVSLPPWKKYSTWTFKKQAETDKLNAWLRSRNAVDITKLLDTNGDGEVDTQYKGDYLHPNAAGYNIIANAVKERLRCGGTK